MSFCFRGIRREIRSNIASGGVQAAFDICHSHPDFLRASFDGLADSFVARPVGFLVCGAAVVQDSAASARCDFLLCFANGALILVGQWRGCVQTGRCWWSVGDDAVLIVEHVTSDSFEVRLGCPHADSLDSLALNDRGAWFVGASRFLKCQ